MQLPSPDLLIERLAQQIAPQLTPDCALVGIHTGGVWVMDALIARLRPDLADQGSLLGHPLDRGVLDISFYRDDFSRIGLHPEVKPSHIPFEVEGRTILLIDDVLYTGRTIRAAMNLLFDYGRPAAIRLAVLVDRGGRELPLCPDYQGIHVDPGPGQHISLERDATGGLHFIMKQREVGA